MATSNLKINGNRYDNNGWIYLTIKGTIQERGFAHGYLLAKEITQFIKTMAFLYWQEQGQDINFFLKVTHDFFCPIIKEQYSDIFEEMEAIAQGVIAANKSSTIELPNTVKPKPANSQAFIQTGTFSIPIDVDVIALLNCIVSMDYLHSRLPQLIAKDPSLAEHYPEYKDRDPHEMITAAKEGGASSRCSAFMAVGEYTSDGKIVCAHNTFDNFATGQFDNIILSIEAANGTYNDDKTHYNMLFQTFPGGIFSGTDFFVTSAGILGTETTIGGFNVYENKAPICVRVRKAMEYGKTLDDYVRFLKENNSGDYACSWLFGDTNSNEIMRIELGLKYVNVQRTSNGYFIGFNAPYDAQLRNLECGETGFYDIRRHNGSRRVRLEQIVQQFKGKINKELATNIIADHYDVYLNKPENKCSRTVCSHYDLDAREYMSQADRPKPFQPRGAVDGKVIDTNLAKQMSFLARFGNSCGTPFVKDAFCNKNLQWKFLESYLRDRPTQPWTICKSIPYGENLQNSLITFNTKTTPLPSPIIPSTTSQTIPTLKSLSTIPLTISKLGGSFNSDKEYKTFIKMFKTKHIKKSNKSKTKKFIKK